MRIALIITLLALTSCIASVNVQPPCTDTVVCEDQGREVVCPSSLTVCATTYQNCRTLPCAEALVTCEHKGEQYASGEIFADECNRCTCQDTGNVVCTNHPCDGTCTTDEDCPQPPQSGMYCPPPEDTTTPPCPPLRRNVCIDGRCTLV